MAQDEGFVEGDSLADEKVETETAAQLQEEFEKMTDESFAVGSDALNTQLAEQNLSVSLNSTGVENYERPHSPKNKKCKLYFRCA